MGSWSWRPPCVAVTVTVLLRASGAMTLTDWTMPASDGLRGPGKEQGNGGDGPMTMPAVAGGRVIAFSPQGGVHRL